MFLPAHQPFSFHAVIYLHGWMQLAAFKRWGAWKGLVFWFWDWKHST
jgi:hypothetical protein